MVTPDYNKVNSTSNRDSSVTPTDEKTRRKPPAGDFNKVVEEVDERDQPADSEDTLDLFSPSKKKASKTQGKKGEEAGLPQGPFGLARGYRDAADEQEEEKEPTFAPIAQVTSLTTTAKVELEPEVEAPIAPIKHTDHHHPLLKPFNEKNDERNVRFAGVEQPDLASVTPYPLTPPHLVNATVASTASIKAEAVPVPQSIQEVIDQIVSKVLLLKESGKTETVIELQGSFKGSRLIVTEVDSAKGQINITVDNLSGENQRLLETNRLSLVNDLLEKGIHVHIFTASATRETTGIDVATNEQSEQGFRDNPEDNPRRDGKRQKSDEQT